MQALLFGTEAEVTAKHREIEARSNPRLAQEPTKQRRSPKVANPSPPSKSKKFSKKIFGAKLRTMQRKNVDTSAATHMVCVIEEKLTSTIVT